MNKKKIILRSIGIIILIILFFNTDRSKFLELSEKINLNYFFLSVILFPVFIFFKILRWRSLLAIQNIRYPLMPAIIAYFVSILFGVITPGRVGEISRALYLKDDCNIAITRGLPSIVMDRLLDLCVLLISASISIVFLPNQIANSLIVPLLIIIFTIIVFIVFMFFGKKPFKTLISLIQKISFFKKSINYIYSTTKKLHFYLMELLSVKLFYPFLLTIINISFFFTITLLIAKAINIPDQFLLILIPTIVVANIVGLLPITISGVGTRDAIFVSVFTFIGIENPIEHAILFSFGFLTVFTGLSTLLGLFAWLIKPMNFDVIKRKSNQLFNE
tara:strand:- start:45643 stop:46638 length:996 start_codon:yes stop_codon:yes gene_type:complete